MGKAFESAAKTFRDICAIAHGPTPTTDFKPPRKLPELVDAIASQNPAQLCHCDTCSPHLYQHCARKHAVVDVTSKKLARLNRYGEQCFEAPNLLHQISLVKGWYWQWPGFEMMHLARQLIQTLVHPLVKTLHEQQLAAIEEFHQVYAQWDPPLFDSDDLSKELVDESANFLMHFPSIIFFLGQLPPTKLLWVTRLDDRLAGQSNSFRHCHNATIKIELDKLHNKGNLDASRKKTICLKTLLHEMLHVFLHAWSCFACPTIVVACGQDGHGRTFQIVRFKPENAVLRHLNIELKFNRSTHLQAHMQWSKTLCSAHELQVYGSKE